MNERNNKFRNNKTIPVLGVPDVRVLKPVHVHLELAVRIDVHVGNEEMCVGPSKPPSLEYSMGLYLIWNLEVLQPIAPTGCFFILKKRIHSFARRIRRNSRITIFSNCDPKP